MPRERLSLRAPRSEAGDDWRRKGGDQLMTVKKARASGLALLDTVRLPGRRSRDPQKQWLETASDMVQCHSQ